MGLCCCRRRNEELRERLIPSFDKDIEELKTFTLYNGLNPAIEKILSLISISKGEVYLRKKKFVPPPESRVEYYRRLLHAVKVPSFQMRPIIRKISGMLQLSAKDSPRILATTGYSPSEIKAAIDFHYFLIDVERILTQKIEENL